MDSWSPAQLKMMQAGGNDQLNNFFSVSVYSFAPSLRSRSESAAPTLNRSPLSRAAIRHRQGD